MENPELRRARHIIENTGTNLFLTGKAGTGKTTFLRRLKEQSPKRMVVLAPTGIAAINAGGVTIHSFFQLPLAPYIPGMKYGKEAFRISKRKKRLIRSIDLVVIDEISMVRADVLDSVDDALRRLRNPRKPFGGVQLLLIGDLQQLAPVVKDEEWALLHQHYDTPFFFGSRALQQTPYAVIELQHVYRQSDPEFISLLNRVRDGRADAQTLAMLNSRHIAGFNPPREEGYIRLVTHNRMARQINDAQLELLDTPSQTYTAKVEGNFPETSYPTDAELTLKEGAQIMFVRNNTERHYFNGMLGTITHISRDSISVKPITGDSLGEIHVEPDVWINSKYVLNETTKEVEEIEEGRFMQLPVRTAWAITIHKSQGLTFERAVIDANQSFAHGQTYVALSRCKTLQGLVLSTPVPGNAIICDGTVSHYNAEMTAHTPTDDDVSRMERDFFRQTTAELFDFSPLRRAVDALSRVLEEHFYKLFPETLATLRNISTTLHEAVDDVSRRFQHQLTTLCAEAAEPATDAHLAERLRKGAAYFGANLTAIADFTDALSLPTDNKVVKGRLDTAQTELADVLRIKRRLLKFVEEKGFSLKDYLAERAVATIDNPEEEKSEKSQKKKREGKKAAAAVSVPSEILHPELYKALVSWRYNLSKEEGVPAFHILHQKALIAIANLVPATPDELVLIPNVGPKTVEKYGDAILSIIEALS